MLDTRFVAVVLGTAALLTACSSELPTSNTFDPNAPETFQAPAVVKGRILLEDGGLARAARVEMAGPSVISTETDQEGSFEITGLVPGFYTLTARQDGYERVSVENIRLAVAETLQIGDIELRLLRASLSGTVRIEGAEEHDGVAVNLASVLSQTGSTSQALRPTQEEDPVADPVQRNFGTITDANGDWRFEGVPIGTYRVIATLPDHTEFCRDLVEITADAGDVRVDSVMRLIPSSAVIRLVDGLGRPVIATNERTLDVELLAFGAVDARHGPNRDLMVATDFVPFTESLAQSVEIAGPDTPDGELTYFAQFKDTCELESPIYTATVIYDTTPPEILEASLNDSARFVTDADGLATLALTAVDATSGADRLRVSVNGQPIDGENGRPLVTQLVLSLGADDGEKQVRLEVIDLAGNVSAPTELTVIKDTQAPVPAAQPLHIAEATDGRVHQPQVTLELDFDGAPLEMAIRNAPGTEAGPWIPYGASYDWQLAAGVDGPRTVYVRVRDAAGNSTDELSIQVALDRSGVVAGTINAEGIGPLQGADISLGGAGSVTSDAEGHFEIAEVPAGFYGLRVHRDGFVDVERAVTVVAGQRSELGEIFLSVARGGLFGVALKAGERDHSGIRIELEGTGFATTTAASGAWRIDNVPAESYTAVARAQGFQTMRWPETAVAAGDVVDLGSRTLALRSVAFGIAGGAALTNQREVSLELFSDGAAEFRVSEDPLFDGVPFDSFDPIADHRFTLSAGDGLKTVYLQFRDGEGSPSPTFSEQISLDTTPPTGSVSIVGALADGATSSELTAVLEGARLRIQNDGAVEMWATGGTTAPDCADADWAPVRAELAPFTLVAEDDAATVWLCLRDAAGNVNDAPISDVIAYDGQAPSGCEVRLTGRSRDGEALEGQSAGREVDYVITCDDTPAQMYLVADDVAPDCGAVAFSAATASGQITLKAGDGEGNAIFGCFRDSARNSTSAIRSNEIRVDTRAPANLELTLHDGRGWWGIADEAALGFDMPVTLSAGESGRYEIATNPGFRRAVSGDFDLAEGTATTRLVLENREAAAQTFYLRVTDAVGNVSSSVLRQIQVDITRPSGSLSLLGVLADGTASESVTTDLDRNRLRIDHEGANDMLTGTGAVPVDCSADSGWVPVRSEVAPFALAGPGEAAWLCLRDAAGNRTERPLSDRVAFDDAAPANCTLSLTGRRVDGSAHATQSAGSLVDFRADCDETPAQMVLVADGPAPDCASANYDAFQSNGAIVLPAGDGPGKTASACFRDAAGNSTALVVSNAIEVDTVAPGPVSLRLGDGGGWWGRAQRDASGLSVPVHFSAGESGRYEIDNAPGFTAPVAGDYDAADGEVSVPFDITAQEGLAQEIYLRVSDSVGNMVSSVARITVDFTAPDGTLTVVGTLADGEDSTAFTTALGSTRLAIAAVGATQMRVGTGDAPAACDAEDGWVPVAEEIAPFALDPAATQAWLCLRDEALNTTAAPIVDGIVFDAAAPSNCQITLTGRSASGAALADITAGTTVDYAVVCDEVPAQMVLSSGAAPDCEAALYSNFAAEGTIELPAGDGPGKTVSGCFRDAARNASVRITSNALSLDTVAPANLSLTLHDGRGFYGLADQAAVGASLPVRFSASESGRFELATEPGFLSPVLGDYDAVAGVAQASIDFDAADGVTQQFYLRVRDAAGNSSTISERLVIDLEAPTGRIGLVGLLGDGRESVETTTDLAAARLDIESNGAVEMRSGVGAAPEDCAAENGWVPVAAGIDPIVLPLANPAAWLCLRDGAGNVSAAPLTDDIRFDDAAPANCAITLTGRNVDGSPNATATGSATVDYAVRCDEDPHAMALVSGGAAPDCQNANYRDYVGAGTVALAGGDGDGKVLWGCFRDPAGNATALVTSNALTLDRVAPGGLSLTLHDGDGFWSKADVDAFDNTVPLRMQALESGRFELATEPGFIAALAGDYDSESGALDTSIDIDGKDGSSRTVYLRLSDAVGNSATVSQTLRVDLSAPAGRIGLVGVLANGVASEQVTTDLSAVRMEIESSGAVEMLSGTGEAPANCDFDAGWVPVAGEIGPLTLPEATPAAWLCLRDTAGNTPDAPLRDTIRFDDAAPANCRITLSGRNRDGSANAAASASSLVDYVALCDDVPAAMVLSAGAAPDCDNASYRDFDGVGTLTLDGSDGAGKVVTGCFRDAAGNSTALVSSNALTLDTTAPGALTLALHDGDGWWNAADHGAMGFALPVQISASEGGRFELDFSPVFSAPVSGDYDPLDGTVDATVTLPNQPGLLQDVYLRVVDAVGNASTTVVQRITVDLTPPSGEVEIAGGAAWLNASTDGSVSVALGAADEISTVSSMAVYAGAGPCPEAASFGAVTGSAVLSLIDDPATDAEGAYTASACFRDLAGNVSAPARDTIRFDRSVPAITSFTVDLGLSTITRERQVTVTLAVDEGSEAALDGIALSNGVIDCQTAAYEPAVATAGVLLRSWSLSDGDGLKVVFACVRDAAGNVSGAPTGSDPAVTLDTTPPEPGSIVLAGGNDRINDRSGVALLVTGIPPAAEVSFSGDIVLAADDDGVDEAGAVRAQVTLTPGDGLKTITAVLLDEAGNRSLQFSDSVTLDTAAPADGLVSIAGDADSVRTQIVSVAIEDTAPDGMRIWEGAASGPECDDVDCGDCACGDATCGGVGQSPFAPATTFTLSGGPTGCRGVCWQFCDEAGNGSTIGARGLTLDTYIDRPRPTVSDVNPPSHVALDSTVSTYSITITGTGIAYDTEAQVGDFLRTCKNVAAFTDCNDGDVAGTCATTCEVDLPDAIMRNSGAYLVRLVTPDPVAGGQGTSAETLGFNVVAPRPSVVRVEPRGVRQLLDSANVPIALEFGEDKPLGPLKVWGSNFMNNVSFNLGGNPAQVTKFQEVGGAGSNSFYVELSVTTAGLFPSHLTPSALTAVNPAPGGGESDIEFGLNEEAVLCPPSYPCLSDLRWTRTRDDAGRALFQDYQLENPGAEALAFSGGTHATVYDSAGNVLTRVEAEDAGGVVPLPMGFARVRIEEEVGQADTVRLQPTTVRADGTFATSTVVSAADEPRGLAALDLNGDGLVDAISYHKDRLDYQIFPNAATVGGSARLDRPAPGSPDSFGMADMNGDTLPDLIFRDGSNLLVGLNLGNFTFGDFATYSQVTSIGTMCLGDIDEDGVSDVVTTHRFGQRPRLRFGDGLGGFGERTDNLLDDVIGNCRLDDFDGDGHIDLLVVASGVLRVHRGDGAGTFADADVATAPPVSGVYALADMNGDGFDDIVRYYNSGGDGYVSVQLWNGTGMFGYDAAVAVITDGAGDTAVNAMTVAELTGDGHIDVLVGADRDGTYIVPGNGDGTMNAAGKITLGGRGNKVTVADMNGDGVLDPVWSNENGSLEYRLANTVVDYGGSQDVPVANVYEAVGVDLDSDGDLDLVTVDNVDVRIHLNPGDGSFDAGTSVASGGSPRHVVAADFNLDGNADFAVLAEGSRRVRIYFGDGAGGVDSSTEFGSGSSLSNMHVRDGDGDGTPDLFVANSGVGGSGAEVTIFLNDGTGDLNTLAPIDVEMGQRSNMAVFDANGDGLLEIYNAVWNNNWKVSTAQPGGVYSDGVGFGFGPRGTGSRWADVDGDGLLDLIAGATDTVATNGYIGYGDGDVLYTSVSGFNAGSDTTFVGSIDLNGDGAGEIIARSDGTGGTRRYFGVRGTRNRILADDLFPGTVTNNYQFFDVNGDGMPDMLAPLADRLHVRLTASGRSWRQVLSEMPAATVAIEPGSNSFDLNQGAQLVKRVGLHLYIADATQNLDALTITLRNPDGDEVVLDDPSDAGCGTSWAGQSTLFAHYPTTQTCAGADLSELFGWHAGGAWTVTIDNAGAQAVELRNLILTVEGSYGQTRLDGRTPATAQFIPLVPTQPGIVIPGSTLGYSDDYAIGCSKDGESRDHFYEVELESAKFIATRAVADFDAAIAVQEGPCAAPSTTSCNDDGGGGMNPLVSGRLLPAGTHCIVVDGNVAGVESHSGSYDLTVLQGDTQCDAAPEVASLINAGSLKLRTDLAGDELSSSCGSPSSNEVVVKVTPYVDGVVTASTDNAGTDFNTVMSLRSTCGDAGSEMVCDNDSGGGNSSEFTWTATAGTTYYLVIEGAGTAEGNFELTLSQ